MPNDFQLVFRSPARSAAPSPRSRAINPAAFRGRHATAVRGRYRIFAAAAYRFYFSASGPPLESDTPYATSSSLPCTPANTFADGTWFFSVSYFDGLLDSGFLPLGPHGETCLRLDLAGGAVTGSPPLGPQQWHLAADAGGVVRVVGFVYRSDASQWAITYTTGGGTPPAHNPTLTMDFNTGDLAILNYALPGAGDDVVVSVRLETRRNDGTPSAPAWVYSDSAVKTLTAIAAGPAAPPTGEKWPGRLP
jgi:hypothetical protein